MSQQPTPLEGADPKLAAHVPVPIAGKVTVPGEVAAMPGSYPNVLQPSPPGWCSSSCPGWAAPTMCQEGPSVPSMWVKTSPQT